MNILEALDISPPELPSQALKKMPRLDPTLIVREQFEYGATVIMLMKPKSDGFYRFTPEQYALLQLFDGERTYAQVRDACREQLGVDYEESQIREFAELLKDTEVFYKSPTEANLALTMEQKRQRRKLRKSKWGDVSEVKIAAWDPDDFLTKLHPYVKVFYSARFNLLMLLAVGFMFYIFAQRWDEIWNDTMEYYTFSHKNLTDLAEFWVLFSMAAFFHESAHGMTTKHYGGRVHSMGFLLMYFMPCFFCDASQVWVYGTKWQRMATMIAGIWIELIFSAAVTVIWWATAPGMVIHDIAYKLILITGIGVIFLNVNPLVKLDGYFMFTELIGIGDIKEKSDAFLTGWLEKNIFGLPVEVEFVPRRRRLLFAAYAMASSAYAYLLMFTVSRIVYRVFLRFTPKYAIWFAALVAFLIFKSRAIALVRFMKSVYLDKKERLFAWFTPQRTAAVALGVALALFLPIWPEHIQGRFALEPAQRALVRAAVPGAVTEVNVSEGQQVAAGDTLVRLRNLSLESQASQAQAAYRVAAARATEAQLRYAGFGAADQERRQLAARSHMLTQQVAMLQVASPISGVVLTPRVKDLQGSYLQAGSEIVEIGDTSKMLARVYVPEFAMSDLRVGAPAAAQLDAFFGLFDGRVVSIEQDSTVIGKGLLEHTEYEGLRPPRFYRATVELEGSSSLRENMAGTAKIFVARRSLASLVWRFSRDLVERKVW